MAFTSRVHSTLRQVAIVVTLSVVASHGDRAAVAAQTESLERAFLIDQTSPEDPLKIVGFAVNGKTLNPVPDFRTENGVVFPGASFIATDEAWLKTSSVQIQNVNKKTVDGIWITLNFPESGVANYIQIGSAERRLGRSPQGNPGDESSVVSLNQRQKLDVPLGANYEATRSLRAHLGLNATTVGKVRIEMVFFSDGTAWSQRAFLRPDPDRPGKFIRICPSEFYAYSPRN